MPENTSVRPYISGWFYAIKTPCSTLSLRLPYRVVNFFGCMLYCEKRSCLTKNLMLRRYLLVIPILLLLLTRLPLWQLNAQERWSAWVYQAQSGQLLRIDNSGTVVSTQRITAPDGYNLPQTLIFSNDGEQVAYITEQQSGFVQQLHIQNLQAGTQLAPISIPVVDTALYRDDYFVLSDV